MKVVERFKRDIAVSPRGRIIEVHDATGIPVKTLRNLYYGRTSEMRFDSMLALQRFYGDGRRKH